MCDVRCIAIIALTKEFQYPLIHTLLGTHRFYTTLYHITLQNSSSSMAASSKPHKISVPNTGEDKTYFYILSILLLPPPKRRVPRGEGGGRNLHK